MTKLRSVNAHHSGCLVSEHKSNSTVAVVLIDISHNAAVLGLPLALMMCIVIVFIVIATQQAMVNQKMLQSHCENTSSCSFNNCN